jgi:hypothetical protein
VQRPNSGASQTSARHTSQASFQQLLTRVGRLEIMIDDDVSVTDIRPPVSGTGLGEDFSI